MPRLARVVIPDHPYHITQRGNGRQIVFQDDEDRLQYLFWINTYSSKYHLSLLAYCLMDNHVHFIAVPRREDSLAKTFSVAHMRYAQNFNKKRKGSGHLWQGRFYSCILDEPYLMAAVRYIERNPVRAKMVEKPWEWKWSSAAAHIGQGDGKIRLERLNFLTDISVQEWKQFIDSEEVEEELKVIRQHTMTGHPLGTVPFVTRISQILGRTLRALPRGRPKKETVK
jgi:putative transposase